MRAVQSKDACDDDDESLECVCSYRVSNVNDHNDSIIHSILHITHTHIYKRVYPPYVLRVLSAPRVRYFQMAAHTTAPQHRTADVDAAQRQRAKPILAMIVRICVCNIC